MERWERINAAPPEEARNELRICCGSQRWAERLMGRRPFSSREAAIAAADEEWFALGPDDWREAFEHHPRIGAPAAPRSGVAARLSAREQSGMAAAARDIKGAILEANHAYEARFGYIFIVCASGKSAEEMLELLRGRLNNDPAEELRIAAEEHAKICALRLAAET
jgi:2-oxo-4-hydroxy-4-carboxy-5-ureidoimidazoline decarboxylase